MSLSIPNKSQANKAMVKQFGLHESIGYYLKKANDAAARLEVGIADKNALTLAKESREIIDASRTAYEILIDATSKEK